MLAGSFLFLVAGCSSKPNDGADPNVTTVGSIEVTARLGEIPGLEEWDGNFPPNDVGYDYAYVLKYEIEEAHRGEVDGETILVAHYNPLKPRVEAADARCPDIGGTVRRFRVGDVHRMALEPFVDDYYMGPMVNKYFDTPEGKGSIHWAVWTNAVTR
jgi:hypothetical protein